MVKYNFLKKKIENQVLIIEQATIKLKEKMNMKNNVATRPILNCPFLFMWVYSTRYAINKKLTLDFRVDECSCWK
jgi:hypothetical protein